MLHFIIFPKVFVCSVKVNASKKKNYINSVKMFHARSYKLTVPWNSSVNFLSKVEVKLQ